MALKEKIIKIRENLGGNPAGFLLRQVYRVFVILPYEAIVALAEKWKGGRKAALISSEKNICFIITSVIFCREKKLTYGVRSVFSAEERAAQTVKTIESVRAAVPEAKIILLESGLKKELPAGLSAKADEYLYVGDNFWVRGACDSRFKSLGEAAMLISSAKHIGGKTFRYFKISGRYGLDRNFNIGAWDKNNFSFHFIRPDYVSTRLYSFTAEVFRVWFFALVKSLPYMLLDYPVEYTLPKFIPADLINKMEQIGVSGQDGTCGKTVGE